MTEILLIEPPVPSGKEGYIRQLGSSGECKIEMKWPPYDLMIMKGMFNKNGLESKMIDANSLGYGWDKVKGIISEERPKLVVFTVSAWSYKEDIQVAKVAKETDPAIKTIPICLSMPSIKENLLEASPHIDLYPYDEPELPVLEYVQSGCNPKDIKGIYYRNNGAIIRNVEHPKPRDMDAFGIPSHDGLPFHLYHDPLMKKRPMTIVNASRGCINKCMHCLSKFQSPLRYRSVANVMSELSEVKKLGIKEVKFFDCGLTNNERWVQELCESMIEAKLDLSWQCNSRADKLSPFLASLMKKAGCHTVCIGSESADDTILKTIKKNETVAEIERGVMNAKNAGMKVLMYFVFGLPGETKETLRKNIEFAKRLEPDYVTFGMVTPVPDTEFYKYLEENNFFTQKYEDADLSTTKEPIYSYPQLSSKEIYSTSMQAYKEFYFRPKYVIRKLINSPSDIGKNFVSFTQFVKRYH